MCDGEARINSQLVVELKSLHPGVHRDADINLFGNYPSNKIIS